MIEYNAMRKYVVISFITIMVVSMFVGQLLRGKVVQPTLDTNFKSRNTVEPAWLEPPVLDYVRGLNSEVACVFYQSDKLSVAPTSDYAQYWRKFDGQYWIRVEKIRPNDIGLPCTGWVLYKNLEVQN